MNVLTRQRITALSSSVGVTVPAGAQVMILQAFTQNVRYTVDGTTTPTASVGHQLKAADPPRQFSAQSYRFGNFKFIEEAGSAVLEVEFLG